MISSLNNPDLYHGWNKHENFFEGWYFKIQDTQQKNVLAFVPGICKSTTPQASHSFVQVLLGNEVKTLYIPYPTEQFDASRHQFDISVGSNRFSSHGMNIDIHAEGLDIRGQLRFQNIFRWPDSRLNPGSMGFYNYLPFMECYSQVCVLHGSIYGSLEIDGKSIDFSEGHIYIEKNWGQAFPNSWIWIQSCSFQKALASVSCSIAHIPFPLGSFRGFLIGFLLENRFYAFTTINRSHLEVMPQGHDVQVTVRKGNLQLSLQTETSKNSFMLLHAPTGQEMKPMVYETLTASVRARLVDIHSHTVLWEDTGWCTGVEYGGESMHMLDNV